MSQPIETHPTSWTDIVLTCRKCSKKLDGRGFGPGGNDSLARALKTELRRAGRRREVQVVETKCLGVCPKHAVTVALGRVPGELLEIPAGTASADVLGRLAR